MIVDDVVHTVTEHVIATVTQSAVTKTVTVGHICVQVAAADQITDERSDSGSGWHRRDDRGAVSRRRPVVVLHVTVHHQRFRFLFGRMRRIALALAVLRSFMRQRVVGKNSVGTHAYCKTFCQAT